MLNGLFVFVALASVLIAAFTNQMQALTDAILTSAHSAVDLAIGLVGVMAFFLGLMRVAADADLMASLSRAVSPVMRLLFPSVPSGSPAMSAMILNIAANMMGLGNAATPFGIKAIEELNKYNSRTGTATNAMVLFLTINTAGLANPAVWHCRDQGGAWIGGCQRHLLSHVVRQRMCDGRGYRSRPAACTAASLSHL